VNAPVDIAEFWRVGRRADPLAVSARHQGAGRFDDPEGLIAVLYGAPTLRTCLLEFLLPWAAAPGAAGILTAIPPATDIEEAADAARDRQLADEPRRVPPALYERDAMDLHDVATRTRLQGAEAIAHELQCWGFAQLDRGALLAPHRPLTQAVVGAVLRGPLTVAVDGLFVESRHEGQVVIVFASEPFAPALTMVDRTPLTPLHIEVIAIAGELGLSA
jgi:hypothetical protein